MIFKKKSEGALLYRIITGNKWDRNDKIRKVSFTTINVIVDSDTRIITDAQMAEELSEVGSLLSQSSAHILFINYQGGK